MAKIDVNPAKEAKLFFDAIFFDETGKHFANDYSKKIANEFKRNYWFLHGKNISKMKAVREYAKKIQEHKLIAFSEHEYDLLNLIEHEELVLLELKNLRLN